MNRLGILCLVLAAAGCAGKEFPDTPANLMVREPVPDSIESVVFLVGDAGAADLRTSPVLQRLQNEIDQWSQNLGRAGAVVALFLGDNVYPKGLRDRDHPEWAVDSARLQSQLDIMTGEHTRRQRTRAVFVAGNHDWGNMPGARGRDRLYNQAMFIARRSRLANFEATMLPPPGDATVARVDVGRYLRLLLIDSAWWLLEANRAEKERFLRVMEQELRDTDGRQIIIGAHHPWQSGSSHGGLVPFWKGLGVRWFLNRSGTTLQDINSLPYRELKTRLAALFARYGKPMLWAGGHDHNLQVLRGANRDEPQFSVVSGALSKATKVGPTNSTLFARDEPGFMRVVALRNGTINLFVVSGNLDYLKCGDRPSPLIQQCVEIGSREFRTVYSIPLSAR